MSYLIQRCRAAEIARACKAPVMLGVVGKVLCEAFSINEPSCTGITERGVIIVLRKFVVIAVVVVVCIVSVSH
jgi:hypothetical protein